MTVAILAVSLAVACSPMRAVSTLPSFALPGAVYLVAGASFNEFAVYRLGEDGSLNEIVRTPTPEILSSNGSDIIASADTGWDSQLFHLSAYGFEPVEPAPLLGSAPVITPNGAIAFHPLPANSLREIVYLERDGAQPQTILSHEDSELIPVDHLGEDILVRSSPAAAGDAPLGGSLKSPPSSLIAIDPRTRAIRTLYTPGRPIGTVRSHQSGKIAILVRSAVSEVHILDGNTPKRRPVLLKGWGLLDWSPDGTQVLLFRENVLALASVSGGALRVLGTVEHTIRSGSWLSAELA